MSLTNQERPKLYSGQILKDNHLISILCVYIQLIHKCEVMQGTTRPASFITEDCEASETDDILRDALKDGHTILHLNYKGLQQLPPALLDKSFDKVKKLFLKRNRLTTLVRVTVCLPCSF